MEGNRGGEKGRGVGGGGWGPLVLDSVVSVSREERTTKSTQTHTESKVKDMYTHGTNYPDKVGGTQTHTQTHTQKSE